MIFQISPNRSSERCMLHDQRNSQLHLIASNRLAQYLELLHIIAVYKLLFSDQDFTYCRSLLSPALTMKAAGPSERSVYIFQSTRHNISEDSNLSELISFCLPLKYQALHTVILSRHANISKANNWHFCLLVNA